MSSSRGNYALQLGNGNERSPFDSTDRLDIDSRGASVVNLNDSDTNLRAFRPSIPLNSSGMSEGRYRDLDNGQPFQGYTQWQLNEKNVEARSRRSKWIVIGCLIGLVVLIGVGVGVGITISKNKPSSSSDDDSTAGVVTQTNPNDPSTFIKDPALIQSFYGIAYTPEGSQYPQCGNSLSQVITDIQLLSQLTTRIRLYGADCNQSSLVLEAIKQTKVNMTVWLANYNEPTDPTAYERQLGEIVTTINAYGTDNIGGVTVGNEWMLNYLDDNGGGDDPNGPVGQVGAQLLIVNITDTRNTLNSMGLSSMPVGTAEAGSYFNNDVLEAVAYGMSNVHPWFANVSIDQAAGWTAEFFEDNNVELAASLSNTPYMYIAETGWPTDSSDASNESNGPSNASVANLQTYLDTFVCPANANGTQYFFFEYFDETWKAEEYGGVEGFWGIFNANRTLKAGLTIPNCTSTSSN